MSGEKSVARHAVAVEEYLNTELKLADAELDAGREHARALGLPSIEVSPAQGKMLQLLAQISGARRVLEIGTLAGYSTGWLARGVGPSGKVITCEFAPLHASVARENLERAGLADRVQILLGVAAESLRDLISRHEPSFDLIFIDADKRNNPVYLELALELSHSGTVLVLDNVVRSGSVISKLPEGSDEARDVEGIQLALRMLGEDSRLEATALQTVGAKGWDGFALARVR